MAAETQIQSIVLNDLTEKIFNEYLYLQIDTGTTMPSESAVELVNGGTQIGNTAALFNKYRDTDTTYSNLTNNKAVMQTTLASGEPINQPINIGGLALMKQQTAGGGMGFPALLPTTFTKTNVQKAKVRAEFKVIRISEV